MGSWLTGQLGSIILDTLNGWIEEFMNTVLTWINTIVFNIPSSSFANDVIKFLSWFTGIFAVVLFLYKLLEYIINTQNGTQQYPLDELFLRVIKSAGAMLVLPWFITMLVFNIALPIADYFAAAGTKFDGHAAFKLLEGAILASRVLKVPGGGIVLLALALFFLVAFIMFLFSVSIFYADLIVMQILVAPVALSMIADDNDFFQVWWRELLSEIVSLLVKLFLVTLVINIIFKGGNILLAIGAAALIIKTPSVLKNMWYGGGTTRATARGAGRMIQMSSRQLISKLLN